MNQSWKRRRRERKPIDVAPRVAVIGHCASGKSTLVNNLRDHGIDAVASAQEHSEVRHLWKRTGADLLIYLDVSLEVVRERRGMHWPEAIYDAQEVRLSTAKAQADLHLETDTATPEATLSEVQRVVENWRADHGIQPNEVEPDHVQ